METLREVDQFDMSLCSSGNWLKYAQLLWPLFPRFCVRWVLSTSSNVWTLSDAFNIDETNRYKGHTELLTLLSDASESDILLCARALWSEAVCSSRTSPLATSRPHAVQDHFAVDFAGNSLDNKQLDLYIPVIAIDLMTELTVPNCLKMHSALCRRDSPLEIS